jgi:hypothetical protein
MLNIYDSRGPSTPTSIGHDPGMPHVLAPRHRNVSGRMTDTVLGRYHTKNSAFDSLYDEVSGLILPHNATAIPAEPVFVGKPASSATTITAGIVATTVAALAIGALGLWCGSPVYDADPGTAIAGRASPRRDDRILHCHARSLIVEQMAPGFYSIWVAID